MIPEIGIMVGAYIVTRMVSLALRKSDGSEHVVSQILAAVTIVVAIAMITALVKGGAGSSLSLP